MRGVFFYLMSLYKNFKEDLERITDASDRSLDEIDLIAVSKKKSIEDIRQVIQAGHRSFGENQIQEVESKWIDLKKEYSNLTLHFIGGIQSRKVKSIFEHCDVVHSIDRVKIIELFSKLEEQQGISRDYFIQINTGNESQKGGVILEEANKFISNCLNNYKLNIVGLMCLPPFNEDPKIHFMKLAKLADQFSFPSLSMGMSNDFKVAIECGATHIRIGTKIFGERN